MNVDAMMRPWEIEWPGGKPISPNLTMTWQQAIKRRPSENWVYFEHEPSGMVRVTIEGPEDQVAPIAAEIRNHLKAAS